MRVYGYFRLFSDHAAVHISDRVSGGREPFADLGQQLETADSSIFWIIVGKEVADIRQCGGTEERIANGMQNNIGVGVAEQATLARNFDSAEDKLAIRGESVNVVAGSDPDGVARRLHKNPFRELQVILSCDLDIFPATKYEFYTVVAVHLQCRGLIGARETCVFRSFEGIDQQSITRSLWRLRGPKAGSVTSIFDKRVRVGCFYGVCNWDGGDRAAVFDYVRDASIDDIRRNKGARTIVDENDVVLASIQSTKTGQYRLLARFASSNVLNRSFIPAARHFETA